MVRKKGDLCQSRHSEKREEAQQGKEKFIFHSYICFVVHLYIATHTLAKGLQRECALPFTAE